MKTSFKTISAKVLALTLSALLLLSAGGCLPLVIYEVANDRQTTGQQSTYEATGELNEYSFEELCDALFAFEIADDNLLINQLVVDPEALGIEVPRPATLGNYSYKDTLEANTFYREVLAALTSGETIIDSKLSKVDQLSSKVIQNTLTTELEFEDYYYYLEPLAPSTGVQAGLPLNLMDYTFRTVDDIEIYLELLEDTPRFFEEVLRHEEEKKNLNILQSREAMEDAIEEAGAYISSADDHILVTTFNEMLDAVATQTAEQSAELSEEQGTEQATEQGAEQSAEQATKQGEEQGADQTAAKDGLTSLTAEELEEYKARNKDAIRDYLIPAYENLINGMESLLPSCNSGTNLSSFARGQEYYELRLKAYGFDMSASNAIATLDIALGEYWDTLMSIPSNVDLSMPIDESIIQSIGSTPEEYISYIREHADADFADVGELNYQTRTAPEASPNTFAMAYYLFPPVDDPQVNIIVFFPNNIYDDVEFYSTVAHEGYPGHMYQTYAYSLTDPSNIRKVYSSSAYAEGWAMYSQYEAMRYLDAKDEAIEAYIAYDKFIYGLHARVDLGVNFEGWSVGDTERYLATYGFDSVAQDLYDTACSQPVAYAPYGLSVIIFDELLERAQSHLGASFDAVDLNYQLVINGPLPFDLLVSEFESWLNVGSVV